MGQATEEVIRSYLTVLEGAILDLRRRIRYDEKVSLDEVHDLMDALHNIPRMLSDYGRWHIEENINWDLKRYDERWLSKNDEMSRRSLIQILEDARQ